MSTPFRIALLLLGALALVLAACGTNTPAAPSLTGRTFLSTGVDGHALVAGTRIQLRFQDGTNLGASAGCNSIGGTYTLVNGVLQVQAGGMTEMGCDQPRHDQDQWLVQFLTSNPTVTLAGNDLMLASGTTAIRLLDREVAEPDLPLLGTTWTLTGIIPGDMASSVPGDVVATLVFAPDGSVDVNAGCNRGGGTAAVQGDQILFGPIATTKMACQGPAGEVEAAVLGVLGKGQVTFSIEASKLTLMAPDGSGIWFAGG